MSSNKIDLDNILDQAINEIRESELDAQTEQSASDRVWEAVRAEAAKTAQQNPLTRPIRVCADFQALIPAYILGAVTDSKALLLKDHLGECVPCRRAIKEARSSKRKQAAAGSSRRGGNHWLSTIGWRAAAAVILFVSIVGVGIKTQSFSVRVGGLISIESIDGELFRVTDDATIPVTAGEAFILQDGEELRTAKDSRAMVALAGGSLIEMRERSELAVYDESPFWNRKDSDAVIDLARGSIIVEAADQESGHLYVDTDDCRVAVTGTVFSVNTGIKGSRVSVIEGEVHVDQPGQNDILFPGNQVTTRDSLGRIPLEEEIAWSQNLDRHLNLLKQLGDLGQEIDQALNHELRYSTRLLDLTPEDTVIYAAIPNLGESLDTAYQILVQKVDSSPELREWWDESVASCNADQELEEMLTRIRDFGDQLGPEITISLQLDADGDVQPPTIMAELTHPQQFREFLEAELADMTSEHPESRNYIHIYEGETPVIPDADLNARDEATYFWIRDDLLTVTVQPARILELAAADKQTGYNSFQNQLSDLYSDGVEWVAGFDLGRILKASQETGSQDEGIAILGLDNVQHLYAKRNEQDGRTEFTAQITFAGDRSGLAGMLDAPAPLGSLDFISPNANLAAAFVIKEPSSLVDELFETLGSVDESFASELDSFENENGIDIRRDFAATLGGEFAFAIDGPLLPKPSWKLIIEVYDPVQLQQTLRETVQQLSALAIEAGSQGFQLEEYESAGRLYYRIVALDIGLSVHYTYFDGYLIAGPSSALIGRALQTRESGLSLTAAGDFSDLLPQDDRVNFSGVVYQNLGTVLGPLANTVGGMAGSISPEQEQLLGEISANTRPSMTLAYGDSDRLSFSYTHEGGFFSTNLANFLSIRSLLDVQELMSRSTSASN
jgi:hypothetical protein